MYSHVHLPQRSVYREQAGDVLNYHFPRGFNGPVAGIRPLSLALPSPGFLKYTEPCIRGGGTRERLSPASSGGWGGFRRKRVSPQSSVLTNQTNEATNAPRDSVKR